MSELHVEVNSRVLPKYEPVTLPSGNRVALTPPIDDTYWLARVPVSVDQAVVCFPKFGVIGIGFQREEDWNTNLPSTCSAEDIFRHIQHNLSCEATEETCLAAIRLLQEWIAAEVTVR